MAGAAFIDRGGADRRRGAQAAFTREAGEGLQALRFPTTPEMPPGHSRGYILTDDGEHGEPA